MAAEPRRFRGNPKRRSDSPARKPVHFFKNILPSTLHDRRLKIPKKFSEKFGDELSAIASISVPNGRTWHLGLQKAENRILFADNWQRFVEYHSIDSGYFLLFRYQGFSNFHVIIFDRSHIEIKYPCHIEDEDTDDDDFVVLEPKPPFFVKTKRKSVNESADQLACRKRRKLCKSRSKNCESDWQTDPIELDGDNMSMGGKVNENEMHWPHDLSSGDEDVGIFVTRRFSKTKFSKETERAIHAAKRCKRTNPSFMVVLQNTNVQNYYMDVPVIFVKKSMMNCSEFIELEGLNGKQWNVRCSFRTGSKLVKRICRGMGSFFRENNLMKGDVCVFELMKKKGILLKASIYHAAGHADPIELCESRSKNCESDWQTDPIELDGDSMSMGGKVNENEMHWPHDLSSGDEDVGILVTRRFSNSKFSKETKRAIHAAKRCKRTNPSFMVVLQNTNVHNYFVDVPVIFVKKYMMNCSEFIELEGLNGKRWNVRCSFRTGSKLVKRICRGMGSFFRENNLMKGDLCVFELMKKKGILLKASIYHAAEHADPSSSKKRCF